MVTLEAFTDERLRAEYAEARLAAALEDAGRWKQYAEDANTALKAERVLREVAEEEAGRYRAALVEIVGVVTGDPTRSMFNKVAYEIAAAALRSESAPA
jgi:hypothetical protein